MATFGEIHQRRLEKQEYEQYQKTPYYQDYKRRIEKQEQLDNNIAKIRDYVLENLEDMMTQRDDCLEFDSRYYMCIAKLETSGLCPFTEFTGPKLDMNMENLLKHVKCLDGSQIMNPRSCCDDKFIYRMYIPVSKENLKPFTPDRMASRLADGSYQLILCCIQTRSKGCSYWVALEHQNKFSWINWCWWPMATLTGYWRYCPAM